MARDHGSWEIVYADGKPNEFEASTIWRAADLLGVLSRQRVALRQLVLADNAPFTAGVGGFRREPICNSEPIESKTH
ncbi:TerB family tellurite resistance protein [Bradyrhizobium sp. AZCC 1610]|uniref:TerB family tellurite resistance protein n=1 Tax=Bradyrhizobium sp. AZCC 1610 TaxID=3117020 RepID=UPI003FA540D7